MDYLSPPYFQLIFLHEGLWDRTSKIHLTRQKDTRNRLLLRGLFFKTVHSGNVNCLLKRLLKGVESQTMAQVVSMVSGGAVGGSHPVWTKDEALGWW